ncbi:protein kinase [Sorangium cellulosum]|uniref:Protein kinase n=1 Tax=Sorangium cellulosum TaxID=56 RepID=A0A2L0ERI1_SORCE|nr:sigma 54-interacting transcriptional regulator [Sorangium cellulosum]AUX41911.1 protein kinase [Sorangium cellulosum]
MIEASILAPRLAERFRLLELAGSGGSGEVWRAVDQEQGGVVALKLERRGPASRAGADDEQRAAARRALAREAMHAALALSPRLPELVDVGWLAARAGGARGEGAPGEERRAFVAMRWVEGRSVAEAARALPAGEGAAFALAVARDAGEALGDLHGIGLAHGDLKPENLILTPEGRIGVIDLGLAGSIHQRSVEGATLRYLARRDVELGDARSRDLLALGTLLAELAYPGVAAAEDPIGAARAALAAESAVVAAESAAGAPLAALCRALLSPCPTARPSAAWVTESARAALAGAPQLDAAAAEGPLGRARRGPGAAGAERDRQDRDARRVRAAYLRLRRDELEAALGVLDGVASWLADAFAVVQRARALAGAEPRASGGAARAGSPQDDGRRLGRLDPDRVARWLTALVGTSAAAWPMGAIAAAPEPALADALVALARQIPPRAWTFADVEAAVLRDVPRRRAAAWTAWAPGGAGDGAPGQREPPADGARGIGAAEAAELALAIARVPPDPLAIEAIEQRDDAPASLVVAAANALRLHGDLGRARSQVLRACVRDAREAAALSAEVLRRAGDRALAEERARTAIEAGADPDGRARAVLARIAIDAGALDAAEALAGEAVTAPLCEVRALIAALRGDTARALAEAARGEALAGSVEDLARTAAVRGYAWHASDPERAHASFSAAVDYAVRAGAVVEEATYRTGQAAAAVDLGDLDGAIATSTRAALLWEHLGRPAQAARALLACAAAYATAGLAHEARRIAEDAASRARDAGDTKAEAYALWAIADVAAARGGDGEDGGERAEDGTRAAAARAAALLAGGSVEDELRAAARVLRHGAGELAGARVEELDQLASRPELAAAARLDWWGARAARALAAEGGGAAPGEPGAPDGAADQAPQPGGNERVLAALAALAGVRAPIASRGPALAAAHALAVRAGRTDVAHRLLAALAESARELCRRNADAGSAGASAASPRAPELAGAVRSLPWVARARALPEGGMRPEQARDLEALVAALGERERLAPLLDRVVDALVLWTGVERGLLLLRAPSGRLVPRAARNLARSHLVAEQLELSETLARRALEAREPVVAFDAAGELPSVHRSVHALKLRSVLAVPLIARGEALGVVYLDDRVRRGAFGAQELRWARAIASVAALAIADAHAQVRLRRAARRAERATARLAEELARREAELDAAALELAKARGGRDTRYRYDAIIGESEPVHAMLRLVDRVTAADVPVLISGESGSGKELVARAIHQNGPRAERPFVSENCGAIPEGLLESALFGHVRGAFTGADRPRAGLFEVADRGTLFLDEIGEMSLAMQTKLLRVLEDGLVRPVGSERARKVDVRVIAATHRDLESLVRARAFREDLLYRLNIITIRVPPLRERATDVPLIVQHLVAKHGRGPIRVTRGAMERLSAHGWPGNVRQLENEIRRAIVLCDGTIDREHLSPEVAHGGGASPRELGLNVRARIDALETELVRDALERTRGNQTQAAKLLGLSRFGLQKMIKRLAIAP